MLCHRIAAVMLVVGSASLAAEGSVPDHDRIRRALRVRPSIVVPVPAVALAPAARKPQAGQASSSDSIWEGLLIGAAIGGAGGYVWARQICGGTDDTECFLISAPVGILGGAGIGALVGAVADKLHK